MPELISTVSKEVFLPPLPHKVDDLPLKQFKTISTMLGYPSTYDWRWFAGELQISRADLRRYESRTDGPETMFDDWAKTGATTTELLKILSNEKKRMDIVMELGKYYQIP